jgi:hypothetical protein
MKIPNLAAEALRYAHGDLQHYVQKLQQEADEFRYALEIIRGVAAQKCADPQTVAARVLNRFPEPCHARSTEPK